MAIEPEYLEQMLRYLALSQKHVTKEVSEESSRIYENLRGHQLPPAHEFLELMEEILNSSRVRIMQEGEKTGAETILDRIYAELENKRRVSAGRLRDIIDSVEE